MNWHQEGRILKVAEEFMDACLLSWLIVLLSDATMDGTFLEI